MNPSDMTDDDLNVFIYNYVKSKNKEYLHTIAFCPFEYTTSGSLHEVFFFGKRIFNSNHDYFGDFEKIIEIRINTIIDIIKNLETHIKSKQTNES